MTGRPGIVVERAPTSRASAVGHSRSALTPKLRDTIAVLVELRLWPQSTIARAFGVHRRTVYNCAATRTVRNGLVP